VVATGVKWTAILEDALYTFVPGNTAAAKFPWDLHTWKASNVRTVRVRPRGQLGVVKPVTR